MTELEIRTNEISVMKEMYGFFRHTEATDAQQATLIEIHRRLISEIARQCDSELVLKTMLTDKDHETLTVHLAHDDVKTYCNIANSLGGLILENWHRDSFQRQIYNHWQEITDRLEYQAREQKA